MRQAFAHDAVVILAAGDQRAPGAAVTRRLCGDWDHEPPCPLAPHHVAVQRRDDELWLRVLFTTEAAAEPDVRGRIDGALRQGQLHGPDGTTSRWRLVSAGASPVRASELEHAKRLAE